MSRSIRHYKGLIHTWSDTKMGKAVKKIIRKIKDIRIQKTRWVFAKVDYIFSPYGSDRYSYFKVKVHKNKIGVIWLFDPVILELGEGGQCIVADRNLNNHGKVFDVVTWRETPEDRIKYKTIDWSQSGVVELKE